MCCHFLHVNVTHVSKYDFILGPFTNVSSPNSTGPLTRRFLARLPTQSWAMRDFSMCPVETASLYSFVRSLSSYSIICKFKVSLTNSQCAELGEKYGPVYQFSLFSNPKVVLSSPSAFETVMGNTKYINKGTDYE